MTITLPPEIERFVQSKLQAGHYDSADEMIVEALEVLRDQETFEPEHERYLRAEVRRGIEQLNRGEFAEFTAESVIREMRKKRGLETGE
jgi:antitoxin ParD1/3/4